MHSYEHPKYSLGFFLLAVVFIISFSLQTFFGWLEKSISYGNLHLSFTSETLDLSADILHSNGRLYVAVPERGFSVVFNNRDIRRFVRQYHFAVRIIVLNVLGTLAFLLVLVIVIFIVRNWRTLWQSLKRVLSAFIGYSHFILTSFLLLILMIGSLFPLLSFLGWWRRFSFIMDYPVSGSLERAVYDFMTMFVVIPRYRLFYALLLTIPSFILRLTVLATFTALIVFWMPVPKVVGGWFERLAQKLGKINPRTVLLAGAAFILIMANLKSFYSNHHLPVSAGGVVQSFQARIFQEGKISYPLPSNREFFQFPYISDGIEWFSQFAPGWPALLSLGYWLRIPWLLAPLFAVGLYFFFYRFLQQVYDRQTAHLAGLLLILSPAFGIIASGYLQYTCFAFFLWCFLYQAQKTQSTQSPNSALMAGMFLGFAVNIDPKIGIFFGMPTFFYLIITLMRGKNHTTAGILLASTLLFSAPILIYNYFLTGKLFVFGFNHLYGAPLGAEMKPLWESLIFALYRLDEINASLFFWPVPSLVFFFVFIILLRTDKGRWDYLLILGFLGSFTAHVVFIDSHPGAPNFLLAMIPVFVLFSSRAIILLPKWLSGLKLAPQRTMVLLGIIIPLMFLSDMGRFFSFPEKVADIAIKLQQKNIKTALVFMDRGWKNYRAGFLLNHPDLKNSKYVIARDLEDYNRKLIGEFTHRPVYRFHSYEEIEFVPLQ